MAEGDTNEPDPFAGTDKLSKRWHGLTDDETQSAKELLADASDKIRQRVPEANDPEWVAAHRRTLERICCAMVKRAMQQDSAGVPGGVSQISETTGPFANSYSWSNPDGNLYLTKEELKDLGVSRQQAFAIDMCGSGDGNR